MTFKIEKNKPELFFGLVGAAGTDLDPIAKAITVALQNSDYSTEEIRLSSLLDSIEKYSGLPRANDDYFEYVSQHMKAGDDFRETIKRPDAVALFGIQSIKNLRLQNNKKSGEILHNTAYIFRSLKNPKEIDSLRSIYGKSFYVIATYAGLQPRQDTLANKIANSRNEKSSQQHIVLAGELVRRDLEEVGNENGQGTRKCFEKADFFVDAADIKNLNGSILRFIELILGHKFHTPTREENAMFHAQAAALRSSEPGRQVGASIVSTVGEVVTVGCNEVPKAGGGLYWHGDTDDHREFMSGTDGIETYKKSLIAETLDYLNKGKWLKNEFENCNATDLAEKALKNEPPVLPKDSKIRSLIEYGRAVHGEMAALMDAAKRGVSVNKCMMFVTTFPCHLCARHIVAAGIARLVYIEPYPKSLAALLYPDSIEVDSEIANETEEGSQSPKIPFVPFVGIAPSKYMELFTANKRKNKEGELNEFLPRSARPKSSEESAIYLEREVVSCRKLADLMKEKGLIKKELPNGGMATASDGGGKSAV